MQGFNRVLMVFKIFPTIFSTFSHAVQGVTSARNSIAFKSKFCQGFDFSHARTQYSVVLEQIERFHTCLTKVCCRLFRPPSWMDTKDWPGEMAVFNRFYTDLGHLSDYTISLLTHLLVYHARMKIFWVKSG